MSHKYDFFRNCCSFFSAGTKLRHVYIAAVIAIGSTFYAPFAVSAEPSMEELKKVLQGQIALMKPELQKKVKGLSMDTKMALMTILAMHNRYSDKVTMRQVMTEVLSDFQSILTGVMTDNPEQTADSARRLANHRIPVGGLLPYLGLENINDERLAILTGINDSVEGNALKLAAAADAGDMTKAASYIGPISSGCVACHKVFRSQPGVSDLLR
jgi:hypothetical protein